MNSIHKISLIEQLKHEIYVQTGIENADLFAERLRDIVLKDIDGKCEPYDTCVKMLSAASRINNDGSVKIPVDVWGDAINLLPVDDD